MCARTQGANGQGVDPNRGGSASKIGQGGPSTAESIEDTNKNVWFVTKSFHMSLMLPLSTFPCLFFGSLQVALFASNQPDPVSIPRF